MRHHTVGLLSIAFTCTYTCTADAALVEWSFGSGGNGHFYEVVQLTSPIGWNAARAAAELRGGHLATLTSSGEQAFVAALVTAGGRNAFLGGYQANPSAPANETWTWVTGEAWDFTAWANGEPNDQGNPNESFLEMYTIGYWNDVPEAGSGYAEYAYVVEVVPAPATALLLAATPLARCRRRR
ncbi:MAG: lectin-like protein [bacterium]